MLPSLKFVEIGISAVSERLIIFFLAVMIYIIFLYVRCLLLLSWSRHYNFGRWRLVMVVFEYISLLMICNFRILHGHDISLVGRFRLILSGKLMHLECGNGRSKSWKKGTDRAHGTCTG